MSDIDNVEEEPHSEKDSEEAQFSLTDPVSLLHTLENADLSEQDTDVLLEEAYKVNRQLREIYQRQQGGRQVKSSSKSKRIKSPTRPVKGQFPKGAPLPPIGHRNNSAARQNAGDGSKSGKAGSRSPQHQGSPASGKGKRGDSAQRREKGSSRPEWNDRFNYS